MARQFGFNNVFNAGELSSRAWSRTDLQQHAHGCALGLNFFGSVEGPLIRRPGTWFRGLTKDQTKVARLIPFARDPEDAQVIEMGEGYFRVWNRDGSPVMDGLAPLEVAHGYTAAQLAGIMPSQNGDIIVLCHLGGLRTRRIKRASPTSWSIADWTFENGPWRTENSDRAFTLTVTLTGGTADTDTEDATSGTILEAATVNLVASSPLFDPGHVGAMYRLRQNDGNPGSETWSPRTDFQMGSYCLSDGKVYKRVAGGPRPSAGTSGQTPLVHESGDAADGRWLWRYMHDGAGVVEITAVTDSTHAAAIVRRPVPMKTTQATSYWSEGSYSNFRGWPRSKAAVREERMVFAGGAGEPDKFQATRTAGFTLDKGDFRPGLGTGRVIDSDGVGRFAGDEPGRIVWLMSGTYLVAGSTAAEVVITGATLDDPLAPTSCVARGLTSYGSADVAPIRAGSALLYVQLGGETIRDLMVTPDQGMSSGDKTVVASHIGRRGVVELAWDGAENQCWVRLADGGLAAMVYHQEQQVFGLTRQGLAADEAGASEWTVESLASLPGTVNTLWMIAKRTKGDAPQRVILTLARRADGMFYDFAELYAGAPAVGVAGLDHLAGEAAAMIADGAEYPVEVSGAGEAIIPGEREAARIVAGLSYSSRFESLPLDLGGPGASQGNRTKISHGIIVMDGVECEVGVVGGSRPDKVRLRPLTALAGPVADRHEQKVQLDGDTATDPRLLVKTRAGYDLEIHSLKAWAKSNA